MSPLPYAPICLCRLCHLRGRAFLIIDDLVRRSIEQSARPDQFRRPFGENVERIGIFRQISRAQHHKNRRNTIPTAFSSDNAERQNSLKNKQNVLLASSVI